MSICAYSIGPRRTLPDLLPLDGLGMRGFLAVSVQPVGSVHRIHLRRMRMPAGDEALHLGQRLRR